MCSVHRQTQVTMDATCTVHICICGTYVLILLFPSNGAGQVRTESYGALFKGIGPIMLRTFPANAVSHCLLFCTK